MNFTKFTRNFTSASRLIRYTNMALKIPRSSLKYHGKVILWTVRQSSSETPKKYSFLSDIEDYVASDFSLRDLQKQKDEETLPVMVTTSSLLDQCETFDDVLKELQKAVHAELLWKDEIMLYYEAFHRIYKKTTDKTNAIHVHDQNRHLLNNLYFQLLLKETLKHAPRFTSYQISKIFAKLIRLDVPPESNTMLIYISILQDKINELFPSDVMSCLSSIEFIEHYSLKQFNSLLEGLYMHLNNQALNAPDFNRILHATPLSHRLSLFIRMSKHKACSDDLRNALIHSMVVTVKQRPIYQKIKNKHEARKISAASRWLPRYQRSFFLKVLSKYCIENADMIIAGQQQIEQHLLHEKFAYAASEKIVGYEDGDHESASFDGEQR